MYILRAVIICLLSALVLSGCMRRASPVAAIQPSQLDDMAYGAPSSVSGQPEVYAEPAALPRRGLFSSAAGL